MNKEITRCDWAIKSEMDIHYHDNEWGYPVFDDLKLFEKINLEAMQSGLSWSTILNKRETLREAFDNFIPEKIVEYDDKKVAELLNNPGIIRNKLKVNAIINNAKAYLEMKANGESLSDFFWKYVDYKPLVNRWKSITEVPAFTDTSVAISKELKKRGFKFVGPTTVYALMQAAGLVNDHLVSCIMWETLSNINADK